MSFSPITEDKSIEYVRYKRIYRNAPREVAADKSPIFYCPQSWPANTWGGYGGPRYNPEYSYDDVDNPDKSWNGNCTWWCCGRLKEACQVDIPAGYGDGKEWYSNYEADGGSVSTNVNDVNPGDIICFRGPTADHPGHVMFVEKVDSTYVYISQSAYSERAVWDGYACRVTKYTKTSLYAGASIDMYKDIDDPYNVTLIGFMHTGGSGPEPPTPTATLTIVIDPVSYTKTMLASEEYVDFTFNITISGIPDGETVSGGNTYPGLTRVSNTGWSYTDYTLGGNTYRYATKTQTLRYTREYSYGYTTTKYMYFNITKSTGTINTTTPMYITVKAKQGFKALLACLRKKGKRGIIYVRN